MKKRMKKNKKSMILVFLILASVIAVGSLGFFIGMEVSNLTENTSNETSNVTTPIVLDPGCIGMKKCAAIATPKACKATTGCQVNMISACSGELAGDIFIKENITVRNKFGNFTVYDSCYNKTFAKQIYCGENNTINYTIEACPAKCGSGACLVPGTYPEDLFLLMGQSNMVGIGPGPLEEIDMPDEKISQWGRVGNDSNKWIIASHPLQNWNPRVTEPIGLGLNFAKTWRALNNDVWVGLIPSAKSSTAIGSWIPGTVLYKDAIARAKAAEDTGGTVKAVLWLQGESNVLNTKPAVYRTNLDKIIASVRKDLGNPNLPFIVGEFTPQWMNGSSQKTGIETVLNNLPNRTNYTFCVQSDGLYAKSNEIIHFDSPSLRILGERYAYAVYGIYNPLNETS
ncbi:MAG: sialate O-acetylesterase [Candidatus Nanoarchaeia archaeon]|nr:sialate O-acetylesterase [Candidatus Nanoarchaeia archaeon]